MLPEGSRVKKGELIARFSSDESEQDLAQALVDLQRNALARAAKDNELAIAQGRVGVDMAQVATQLGIARRYAGADLSTLARNDVLDAIEDVHYLEARQDRSEEHTSELQSLMRHSYAVFCLKKKKTTDTNTSSTTHDDSHKTL